MAVNVDGKSGKYFDPEGGEENKKFPSGMMDKQVLVSSKAASSTTRYAIGLLSNNELHVTPLVSVKAIGKFERMGVFTTRKTVLLPMNNL